MTKQIKLYGDNIDFVTVTDTYIELCRETSKLANTMSLEQYYTTDSYKTWDKMTTELAQANNTDGYEVQFAVWDYFEHGDCCLVD